MKKLILAVIFACCSLALVAQDDICVDYQGDRPTISDFAWAFVAANVDDEGCIDEATGAVKQALTQHRQGLPLEEGETLTIDEKNGFVLYESRYEEHLLKIEMCFWNESDRKHRMFAYNVASFVDGKYSPGQFDILLFFRYDNASKKMSRCYDPGFEVMYGDDGAWLSYDLPRTGKDIIVNYWYNDGTKKQKTLSWNGRKFL